MKYCKQLCKVNKHSGTSKNVKVHKLGWIFRFSTKGLIKANFLVICYLKSGCSSNIDRLGFPV